MLMILRPVNHLPRLPCPTRVLSLLLLASLFAGCKTAPRPGAFEPRKGDEIVVAGQFVHTGTRVVTWMDPGGYDAYRVERRFSPHGQVRLGNFAGGSQGP